MPTVTHAAWWNPFSWFRNNNATPVIQQVVIATTSIPANIEKKEVGVSKKELKTNVVNLPNGSIVEVDSNGNILRYIKEVVKEEAPKNDNYFSAQIDVLSQRLKLLEQQLNIKEDISIDATTSSSVVFNPTFTDINQVVTPSCNFKAERGVADTGNKAVTFTWSSDNTSSLDNGEIGEIYGKDFMDMERPNGGYNQLIGKISATQGNTVFFRIPFETKYFKMVFKVGAVCYGADRQILYTGTVYP